MNRAESISVIRSSALAVLAWVDGAGQPSAHGVVVLPFDGRPAVAFTYAQEALAREVAAATGVAMVAVDDRSTGPAFQPLLVRGRPKLLVDPTGTVFVADLLEEELRRFPPARVYADSPLLRREHWWYLPRLIVSVDPVTVQPMAARLRARDYVLVVAGLDGLAVAVARVNDEPATGGSLALQVVDHDPGPPPGPAVLFGQDASLPDLERWSQWQYRGTWDGDRFAVREAPERVGLGPIPTVWRRWRRQRDLERRCRRAIPG